MSDGPPAARLPCYGGRAIGLGRAKGKIEVVEVGWRSDDLGVEAAVDEIAVAEIVGTLF